jgi:hypothetical protein
MGHSLRDEAETRVVIVGVVTGFRCGGLLPSAHEAPGPPIAGPWCRDGVLAVIASCLVWEKSFPVTEHDTVFRVRKRPAGLDQSASLLSFGRQGRQGDDLILRGSPGFGFESKH